MRQRKNLGAYSPAWSPASYQSGAYGSQVYAQPVGFWGDVGNFFGTLGNNWQGGEDQAMWADPNASYAPGGVPYATVSGAENAGVAAAQGIKNLASPVADFFLGLARGGGIIIGGAIVLGAISYELRTGGESRTSGR
jgi:hypothetical protein